VDPVVVLVVVLSPVEMVVKVDHMVMMEGKIMEVLLLTVLVAAAVPVMVDLVAAVQQLVLVVMAHDFTQICTIQKHHMVLQVPLVNIMSVVVELVLDMFRDLEKVDMVEVENSQVLLDSLEMA
jgi:L-cystine uptake protein TcyP (sodium:dicarboxylate symporter family)